MQTLHVELFIVRLVAALVACPRPLRVKRTCGGWGWNMITNA